MDHQDLSAPNHVGHCFPRTCSSLCFFLTHNVKSHLLLRGGGAALALGAVDGTRRRKAVGEREEEGQHYSPGRKMI